MTGKTVGSKDDFSVFNQDRRTFASLDEVKKYLNEQYGDKTKEKIYRDGNDGEAVHVGYIYRLGIVRDYSHAESDDNKPWYQQDWVEVSEIKATPIVI